MVLFWRGVWHTADILMQQGGVWGVIFYEPITVVWTVIIMLLIGLFVSFFIGESIVISGLRHDKKIFEKTAVEVAEEEGEIARLERKVDSLTKDIADIKNVLVK